jgi:hypothetical protein
MIGVNRHKQSREPLPNGRMMVLRLLRLIIFSLKEAAKEAAPCNQHVVVMSYDSVAKIYTQHNIFCRMNHRIRCIFSRPDNSGVRCFLIAGELYTGRDVASRELDDVV